APRARGRRRRAHSRDDPAQLSRAQGKAHHVRAREVSRTMSAPQTTNRALVMLKFGAAAWNCWRRENPALEISLDGAKLDGLILTGIDFSGVSLRGASMHATNLMSADLRRADLTGANLAEADLIAAKLDGAILVGANLREA